MSDTAPILLRPRAALADAMTAAAEARGISRQAWMLSVLEGACSEYMSAISPDDVPLFADHDDGACPYGPTTCGPHGRTLPCAACVGVFP